MRKYKRKKINYDKIIKHRFSFFIVFVILSFIVISFNLTDIMLVKSKEYKIDYSKVVVHAPFIINLANGDEDKYNFSI